MSSRTYWGCVSGSPPSSRGEEADVCFFLDQNRQFLENYVLNTVSLKDLEKWYFKKMKRTYLDNKHSLGRLEKLKVAPRTPFDNLLKILHDNLSENALVWELAKSVTSAVGVEAYRIYKMYPDHPAFVQCFPTEPKKVEPGTFIHMERADPEQIIFALEAAKKKTCVRLTRTEDPYRFPTTPTELFSAFKLKKVRAADNVLYHPIFNSDGKTNYIIEMWRIKDRFKDRDEQICSHYMIWGSMALHFCSLYLERKLKWSMSDFLCDVVKAIFEEMVSLDHLIKRILEFAQQLVSADRASLFLVDYINNELVSTVFDLKYGEGNSNDVEKKEIRMPIYCGIAGYVATSGKTMNIPDAYADRRFNRQVDESTGYRTVGILCMPIKVDNKVIGVVQMVNKRNDLTFGHEDEVSFETFSTFFGLALHNARLYDRIIRNEQKYKVALEVLSYHNTCREREVQDLLHNDEMLNIELNKFSLDPYQLDEFQKCRCVITMFERLFGLNNFDKTVLTRFVLTVKKNYRTVPYHNFDHGWSVAHTMYVILKNDYEGRFDYKRRLALFVASLCHDLDHRGYTNKYMSETASPLAAMYTTSTLEHHHFNITVTILQQDGHNIFAQISSEEYKEILGFIRQAILATDLAAFFPNLEKINKLYMENSEPTFDWKLPIHRDLAMAISMTAADLSASAKPWEVQLKTVSVIFEEFYAQGDKEKAQGKVPIPMMDRNKPEEQAASQVGFLSQICIPCYTILNKILPHTHQMIRMAQKNLDCWTERARKALKTGTETDNDEIEETYNIRTSDAEIEDVTSCVEAFDINYKTAASTSTDLQILVDDKVEVEKSVKETIIEEEDVCCARKEECKYGAIKKIPTTRKKPFKSKHGRKSTVKTVKEE